MRNFLLKRESDNLDIATDALPDEVEKVLESAGIEFKQVGKKYGTILAIAHGQKIEITTFRAEGRYSDQRHPDSVKFIVDYINDAKRRDLTINALYLNPVTCEIFDPEGGLHDLGRKIIKFVGDPKKRIEEDPLRMLRAVRFVVTLGFKFEKNSFAAIKTRAKLIRDVSGTRIRLELDKILLSQNARIGLELLDAAGLLKCITPELIELKRIDHKSSRHHREGNMFVHTMLALENSAPDLLVRYAVLFHDIGKASVKMRQKSDRGGFPYLSTPGHEKASVKIFLRFAQKYSFSRADQEIVGWLILHHDDRTNFCQLSGEKQIKYALEPRFARLLDVWFADSRGNLRLNDLGTVVPGNSPAVAIGEKFLRRIAIKSELLNKFARGEFIITETGLRTGIKIGQILDEVKIKIILGQITDKTSAINFLKKFKKNT